MTASFGCQGSSLLLQGMLLCLIAFSLANAPSGITELGDSSVVGICEVLTVIVSLFISFSFYF